MATTNINVRVDSALKQEASVLQFIIPVANLLCIKFLTLGILKEKEPMRN